MLTAIGLLWAALWRWWYVLAVVTVWCCSASAFNAKTKLSSGLVELIGEKSVANRRANAGGWSPTR